MWNRKSTTIPATLIASIFLLDVVIGGAAISDFLPQILPSNTLVYRPSDVKPTETAVERVDAERRSVSREAERENEDLFLNTLWSIIVIGRQRPSRKSPHRNLSDSAGRSRHKQQTRYDHNCFFSPMNCVLWHRPYDHDTATTTTDVDDISAFWPNLIAAKVKHGVKS